MCVLLAQNAWHQLTFFFRQVFWGDICRPGMLNVLVSFAFALLLATANIDCVDDVCRRGMVCAMDRDNVHL
jgi:hypothetical protein